MTAIYVKDEIRGSRKVGFLTRKKYGLCFWKNVVRSIHFMRVVQGYGIQKEVFDKYLRGKKGRIFIKEKDTGKTLVASIDTWTAHSRAGNYGGGAQIFLAERFMHGSDNFDRSEIGTLSNMPTEAKMTLREKAIQQGWYKPKVVTIT